MTKMTTVTMNKTDFLLLLDQINENDYTDMPEEFEDPEEIVEVGCDGE